MQVSAIGGVIEIAIKLITQEFMVICKIEPEGLWKEGNPKKWYYAIPIIVFWTMIIAIVLLKTIE